MNVCSLLPLLGALLFSTLAAAQSVSASALPADSIPTHLPGELSADDILNGEYLYPPSPQAAAGENSTGFAADRLGKVPPPGVHPRILISPDQLPDLRKRLKETETGRAIYEAMRKRIKDAIGNPDKWGAQMYDKLAGGDAEGAGALLKEHKGFPPEVGHYKPWIYAIVLESLDCLISEDAARGKRAATALATYAKLIEPRLDAVLAAPLNDDAWRAKIAGPITGAGSLDQGVRDVMGNHLLGYGYDFAYNFMSDDERGTVRRLISKATRGRLWMGARLPHHFRNWNWIAVGLGQPLLALAIEGEEGYDPRVYKLGVEIARDYLSYGISAQGTSTEAVGYTQFGFVWASPFIVAAARHGDNLLVQDHHRAMIDWYLEAKEPFGPKWTSHGDGGDTGPAIWTMAVWKRFFPDDPKIDYLWQQILQGGNGKALQGDYHIIEPLLFAADPIKDGDGKLIDYHAGEGFKLPVTWFDPGRSSLIARNDWQPDAMVMQFECRTDSVGASHEHADRGNFTLSALGRSWAEEKFRSVETRHHNCVLIDGKGQGYWPGPGKWLGLEENKDAVIATVDAKDAYDWMWPKEITTEDPGSFVRFNYARWESYRSQAAIFRKDSAGLLRERDTRPSVVAHWTGFLDHDPRMWDEDTWPVRLPHNPVQRAFRSVVLERGQTPYMLVIDDIEKDQHEHLYEWLMQTGPNTDLVSMTGNDIILCDATVPRDENGRPKPEKGDRLLLVRVLEMNEPTLARDYSSRPSFRLESFERKDTLVPEQSKGFLSGARSFGTDKRLVIASRSVAPDFKILLYPHRAGDPLPVTTWNLDKTVLTIEFGGKKDVFTLQRIADGRTLISKP